MRAIRRTGDHAPIPDVEAQQLSGRVPVRRRSASRGQVEQELEEARCPRPITHPSIRYLRRRGGNRISRSPFSWRGLRLLTGFERDSRQPLAPVALASSLLGLESGLARLGLCRGSALSRTCPAFLPDRLLVSL